MRLIRNIFRWSRCLRVSKRSHPRCLRCLFLLNLNENITLFKYKNGGVEHKNFVAKLLKWSCLRLSVKIFFGSPCIRVSETSQIKCLRRLSLLNLSENKKFFSNTKMRKWNLKIFLLNYRNDLVLRSVETSFLKVGGYVSWKWNTRSIWKGRFCWISVKIP